MERRRGAWRRKAVWAGAALGLAVAAAAGVFLWKWNNGWRPAVSTRGFEPVEEVTLVVATDLHYLAPELTDGGAYFQTMVENSDGKMTGYSQELLDAFVSQVIREAPDGVILPGDLSFNGEALSHQGLARGLRSIEEAGIPVYVIPGNHDLLNPSAASFSGEGYAPAETVTPEGFAGIYEEFGYGEALSRDPHSLSYTAQLAPNLRLLMVDANTEEDPCSLSDLSMAWVEEQLRDAAREKCWVVAVNHQNLFQHSSLLFMGYILWNGEELLDLYERYPVVCSLSGHIHLQHIMESGSGFPEIVTSSLAVSPHQYGVLELSGREASYRTEAVDVAAWAAGAGREEPELLDFAAYSRRFFVENGVRQGLAQLGEGPEAEELAGFFGEINAWYFAGRMDAAPWDEDLFSAAREQSGFLGPYLASIAGDGFRDQTRLEFSFGE